MKQAFFYFINLKKISTFVNLALLITGILALTACGGGGGSSAPAVVETQPLTGGGVKGPLAGAVVTAYSLDTTAADFKGSVSGSGSTDAQAKIQNLSLPFPLTPPYILEITSDADTIDITTGLAPVITTMRTVVTQTLIDTGEQIYATPLTTMAVDIAIKDPAAVDAATFETALETAASQVSSTFGFGIGADVDIFDTPPLIDDTTDTSEEQAATAAYRTAVEALTAVAFEMQKLSTTGDTDAVLTELSNDLADGVVDSMVDGAASTVYQATALDVLSQDPATLIIPNTTISVADIEQELQTETATTGETTDTTPLDTINVEADPAETNADIDLDGVLNVDDAFPENFDEQLDTDGDNIGNNADTDDDNDGWADTLDDYPLDSSLFLDPATDRDGDAVANGDDNCALVSNANQADTDSDGVGDACSNDADGDGILNDGTDNCPVNANPDQLNTDELLAGGDASGDVCDDDDDADGVIDANDLFPLDAGESVDLDGDNIGDNADTDTDGDGVLNVDETTTDPLLWDTDGDGFSDSTDLFPNDSTEALDTDLDGVGNNSDAFPTNKDESVDTDGDTVGDNGDNCPAVANTSQTNTDGAVDGGDACDLDDDNDGVADVDEPALGTDPLIADSDSDGVNDGSDAFPTDGSETTDTDGDSLGDNGDNCPTVANTDQTNTDGAADGGDACDADDDNDGLSDIDESIKGTNPLLADTDSDTVGDATDNCPVNANSDQADADTDGIGDVCDVTVPNMIGVFLQDYSATSGDEWDGSACTPVTGGGSEFWQFEQMGDQLTVNNVNGDWAAYSGTMQVDGTFSFAGSDVDLSDSFSGSFNQVAGTFTGTWTGETNTNGTSVCTATFSVSGASSQAVSEQTVAAAGGAVWMDTDSWFDGTAQQIYFDHGVISEALEAQFTWDEPSQAWFDIAAYFVGSKAYLLADGTVDIVDDIVIINGYVSGGETAILQMTSGGSPVSHEVIHVDLEEYNIEGKAMLDIIGSDFEPGLPGSPVFGTGARAYLATLTSATNAYNFWCDDDWDDWFTTNLTCDNIIPIAQVESSPGNWDPVPATALTDLVVNSAIETIDPTGSSGPYTPGVWIGGGFDGNDFDLNAYLVSDDGSVGGSAGTGGTVHFYRVYWGLGTSTDTGVSASYSVVNRGGIEVIEWTTPDTIVTLVDAEETDRFLFLDTTTEAGGFGNIVRTGDKFTPGTIEQEILLNTTALDQFKIAFSYTTPAVSPAEFAAATNNGINFTDDSIISLGSSFGVRASGILRSWETNTHEVDDYYVFDASGNGGRWVHQEWLLADDSTAGPVDNAMTWMVNADGNMDITITSTGSVHQVALNTFDDTLRPDLLVVVDGVYDGALDGSALWPVNPERLLTQVQYESELSAKVDLVDLSTISGNYHFAWNVNEQIHLKIDGTFDEYFDDGGVPTLDSSGTWTVNAATDFFTLDWCAPGPAGCGDEDIVAVESIVIDTFDVDGDGNTTEDVVTVAGWWLVDPSTGMGSMYRDPLLLLP